MRWGHIRPIIEMRKLSLDLKESFSWRIQNNIFIEHEITVAHPSGGSANLM
jgi:hypothetical protein